MSICHVVNTQAVVKNGSFRVREAPLLDCTLPEQSLHWFVQQTELISDIHAFPAALFPCIYSLCQKCGFKVFKTCYISPHGDPLTDFETSKWKHSLSPESPCPETTSWAYLRSNVKWEGRYATVQNISHYI